MVQNTNRPIDASQLKPGDVISIPHDSADATGHVAIYAGDGITISAASLGLVYNDWGFRPSQKSETKIVRRYQPIEDDDSR